MLVSSKRFSVTFNVMRRLLFVTALFATVVAADTFKDVEYIHQGENGKGQKDGGQLIIDSSAKHLMFESKATTELDVPFDRVTHLVYEKASKPRYAAGLLLAWPLLFTKSKQHFLTVQYTQGGEGKYAVFHLSKGNYREILASAEAATGQKIDRQEER